MKEGEDRTSKLAALWVRWREELHAEVAEGTEEWLERWEAGRDEILRTNIVDLAAAYGQVRGFRIALDPLLGADHLARLDKLFNAYGAELERRLEGLVPDQE